MKRPIFLFCFVYWYYHHQQHIYFMYLLHAKNYAEFSWGQDMWYYLRRNKYINLEIEKNIYINTYIYTLLYLSLLESVLFFKIMQRKIPYPLGISHPQFNKEKNHLAESRVTQIVYTNGWALFDYLALEYTPLIFKQCKLCSIIVSVNHRSWCAVSFPKEHLANSQAKVHNLKHSISFILRHFV